MSKIIWLDPENNDFPPVSQSLRDPNGLLAAGGDLSASRLIAAYRQGIFPWYEKDQPILWWSPDPRCVLYPDQLHTSRSLTKLLKKHPYQVSFDQDFEGVVNACAAPRMAAKDTWITADMKQAYLAMHQQGIAHSVEVRHGDHLVGGLYGLAIGKLFFGESMFSQEKDCSKIAFVYLVEQLRSWGYYLIDCQVYSDHLASLGACEIPRAKFLQALNRELGSDVKHLWHMEWNPQESSN
ncbi:MAG: leucyl/phenylalanyl-tRNA--protein transferase [Motiliproteus sp.]